MGTLAFSEDPDDYGALCCFSHFSKKYMRFGVLLGSQNKH